MLSCARASQTVAARARPLGNATELSRGGCGGTKPRSGGVEMCCSSSSSSSSSSRSSRNNGAARVSSSLVRQKRPRSLALSHTRRVVLLLPGARGKNKKVTLRKPKNLNECLAQNSNIGEEEEEERLSSSP